MERIIARNVYIRKFVTFMNCRIHKTQYYTTFKVVYDTAGSSRCKTIICKGGVSILFHYCHYKYVICVNNDL